mgnify:CR=1 FL=1
MSAPGMAEGPANKLPEPPKFASDWLLGEPDMIVRMPKAYIMRADGSDIYRSFVIPLDLKEDKWVAGFEVRPSARAVLHHVIIRIDQSGEAREFYEFLKTMETLESTLSKDDTLIFSTDSDFFRYLKRSAPEKE